MFKSYPLRFVPLIQERIWGGTKLNALFGKELGGIDCAGESWELSSVKDNYSVVLNGAYKDWPINKLLTEFGREIMGEAVYSKHGNEFPLLIKFLDSKDNLSLQVHPNDELALSRHGCNGKTELWYVVEAEPGSKIVSGFNNDITKEEYLLRLENKSLPEVLDFHDVKKGDTFFIPPGRIHALGAGIVIAEIQQSSDITYRIYDYNRVDKNGKFRELHTEWAMDCINFTADKQWNKHFELTESDSVQILQCNYFTTNLIRIDSRTDFDLSNRNSFTILIFLEGDGTLEFNDQHELVKMGETLLIPASLNNFSLKAGSTSLSLIEVFI